MWTAQGKPDDPAKFQPFHPEQILYEFDGPRIFTLRDLQGELLLVYWSDETAEETRYIVVPTSDRIVGALRAGEMSVLDALDQPRSWLCDVNRDGAITRCLRVNFDAIPEDALPAAATLLLPTLRPRPRQPRLNTKV